MNGAFLVFGSDRGKYLACKINIQIDGQGRIYSEVWSAQQPSLTGVRSGT